MKQCKTCKNVYEEDKYPACPYCSGERQVVTRPLPSSGMGFGVTIPLREGQNTFGPGTEGPTVPGGDDAFPATVYSTGGGRPDQTVQQPQDGPDDESFPATVFGNGGSLLDQMVQQPRQPAGEPDIAPTEIHIPDQPSDVPEASGQAAGPRSDPSPEPEIPVFRPGPDVPLPPPASGLPVRGWLVVTKGAGLGQDFRIHDAANIIGRSDWSDINLTFDGRVARESAIVTYDDRNCKFFISCHPFTKNNVYLNKEILLAPSELHDYDVVELGETELSFRSFCGGSFDY